VPIQRSAKCRSILYYVYARAHVFIDIVPRRGENTGCEDICEQDETSLESAHELRKQKTIYSFRYSQSLLLNSTLRFKLEEITPKSDPEYNVKGVRMIRTKMKKTFMIVHIGSFIYLLFYLKPNTKKAGR